MDKVLGLWVIMFIVAVSGRGVLTMKQEVEYAVQHDTPSVDDVPGLIQQLATGIQAIQRLTAYQAPSFPCMWCEQLMTMAYNMTVDPALLTLVQNFDRVYVCTYWVPAGYKDECNEYVDKLPDIIKAFANTYLNPANCAPLCRPSEEMNQHLDLLSNIVEKMDGAFKENIFK